MNRRALVITTALALLPIGASAHGPKIGQNGGPQEDAGSFHVEIVPKGPVLQVYLKDHSDKTVSSSGFKGTAIFVPCAEAPIGTRASAVVITRALRFTGFLLSSLVFSECFGRDRSCRRGANFGWSRSTDQTFQRFLPKSEKQNRCQQDVEQGRADQASEDRDCYRVQDFLARRCRIDKERQ